MGTYRLIVKETAEKDLFKIKKSGNQKSFYKIIKILEELKEHSYTATGKPEPLKPNLQGLWSRRINQKYRFVYEVVENIITVYILSAIGQYDDKRF
jgi:toxin YoeB